MSELQNSLADVGAKLQEVTLNVDALKNGSREQKALVENDRVQLTQLQQQFAANSNTSTASVASDLNRTQEMINAARIDFAKELKNVSSILANVNDTLSQKTTEINVELRKHKVRFFFKLLVNSVQSINSLNVYIFRSLWTLSMKIMPTFLRTWSQWKTNGLHISKRV